MKKYNQEEVRLYEHAAGVFRDFESLEQMSLFLRDSAIEWRRATEGERLVITTRGKTSDIGPRAPRTEDVYRRFNEARESIHERLRRAHERLLAQEERNRKTGLGIADPVYVRFQRELASLGQQQHFKVVGKRAIYAYAVEARVSEVPPTVLGEKPKHLALSSTLNKAQTEEILHKALVKADPHFRMLGSKKVEAATRDGHTVHAMPDEGVPPESRLFRLGDMVVDFWAAWAKEADMLVYRREFSAIIVATSGQMARLRAIHPATFVLFKRWTSEQLRRHPMFRPEDAAQADFVEELLELMPQHKLQAWLPQLHAEQAAAELKQTAARHAQLHAEHEQQQKIEETRARVALELELHDFFLQRFRKLLEDDKEESGTTKRRRRPGSSHPTATLAQAA